MPGTRRHIRRRPADAGGRTATGIPSAAALAILAAAAVVLLTVGPVLAADGPPPGSDVWLGNPPGVEATIHAAAARYGVDGDRLVRLADCSSRLNSLAIGDGGDALGLFQLSRAPGGLYWHFLARGYSDPMDPVQASDYAARALAGQFVAEGVGAGSWPCDAAGGPGARPGPQ